MRIISGRWIDGGSAVRLKCVDERGRIRVVIAHSMLSHDIERAFRTVANPPPVPPHTFGRVAQLV